MDKVLLLHSSVDGQTIRICERLRRVVENHGDAATVAALADSSALDLASFDKIVVGASIRYGHHRPALAHFVARERALLERVPTAFFSVSVVARKPDRNRPGTNPYLRKFLRRTRWRPDALAVFAGRIDYPRYGFFDRSMIRLIMRLTGGPTDPSSVVEFTDWQAVDDFGRALRTLVKSSAVHAL